MDDEIKIQKQAYADGFAAALAFVGHELSTASMKRDTFPEFSSAYERYSEHIEMHNCGDCQNHVRDECMEVVGTAFCPFGLTVKSNDKSVEGEK